MAKKHQSMKAGPLLAAALKADLIRWSDGQYFGTASDGEIVEFGTLEHHDTIESFLTSYPTPKDWS